MLCIAGSQVHTAQIGRKTPTTDSQNKDGAGHVQGNGSGLKLYNFRSTVTPLVRMVYCNGHTERFSGQPKTDKNT